MIGAACRFAEQCQSSSNGAEFMCSQVAVCGCDRGVLDRAALQRSKLACKGVQQRHFTILNHIVVSIMGQNMSKAGCIGQWPFTSRARVGRSKDRRQAGRATSCCCCPAHCVWSTVCPTDRRGDVLEPGLRLGSGYHGSCKPRHSSL